jgi:hypothetical protein
MQSIWASFGVGWLGSGIGGTAGGRHAEQSRGGEVGRGWRMGEREALRGLRPGHPLGIDPEDSAATQTAIAMHRYHSILGILQLIVTQIAFVGTMESKRDGD